MSIVVRMEMPKNCFECPLHEFGGVCVLKVEHTAEEWLNINKRRPSNCPVLCQLPEGHGRLIDEKDIWIPYDVCDGHEAMEFVNKAPTIVPAERSEE